MYIKRSNGKFYYTDEDSPEPVAQCDRTGFIVRHCDLVREMSYQSGELAWTGRMVHKDFLLKPNPALEIDHAVYNDPEPVENPRPEKLPPELMKPRLDGPLYPFDELALQEPQNLLTPPIALQEPTVLNPGQRCPYFPRLPNE